MHTVYLVRQNLKNLYITLEVNSEGSLSLNLLGLDSLRYEASDMIGGPLSADRANDIKS
jgi:hypothetical protein